MTNVSVGRIITGTGIPSGSFITAVGTSSVDLNNKCTASGTGIALTISANWLPSTWNRTNLYQISFDSEVMDNCTTWYDVSSIGTSTILTLAEDGPVVSAHAYTLRLCYATNEDDIWHICYPYDPETNDRIALLTNGIDNVQVYDGTGYVSNFLQYPNLCKYLGFYGTVGYHHTLYVNVYDTGSSQQCAETIELSDAGVLDFNGSYVELLDRNSPIVGVLPLITQLIIYKQNSISIAQVNPSGGNDDPLSVREDVVSGIGCPTIRVVQDIGSKHIVFTGDDVILFDGFQHPSIATGNIKYILSNVNTNYLHRSYSFLMQKDNLYCLMLPWGDSEYPNYCIVYNYQTQSWVYWSFVDRNNTPLYSISTGLYQKSYSPRWCDLYVTPTGTWTSGSNQITLSSTTGVEVGMRIIGSGISNISYITDLTGSVATITYPTEVEAGSATALVIGWTAEQMPHRWSDLIINDKYFRTVLGDSSGYLYELHKDNLTDAEYPITATWSTKDYDINRPGCDFRLLDATLCMQLKDGYTPVNILIRASVTSGRYWTAWRTVPLDGLETYMEKKVHFDLTGKTVRFQMQLSDPFIFESMRMRVNGEYKSFKFDQ